MKTLKRIYLQKDEMGGEELYTWCSEQISDDDIEYVLKSESDFFAEKFGELTRKMYKSRIAFEKLLDESERVALAYPNYVHLANAIVKAKEALKEK